MTFTAGNLFPTHSCIGVIWVKPPTRNWIRAHKMRGGQLTNWTIPPPNSTIIVLVEIPYLHVVEIGMILHVRIVILAWVWRVAIFQKWRITKSSSYGNKPLWRIVKIYKNIDLSFKKYPYDDRIYIHYWELSLCIFMKIYEV